MNASGQTTRWRGMRIWAYGSLLLLIVSGMGHAVAQTGEGECTQEFNTFRAWVQDPESGGGDDAVEIEARARQILQRYEGSAPRCESLLKEYVGWSMSRQGDYEGAMVVIEDVLSDTSRGGGSDVAIRLLAQKAWLLERLGRIMDGAQMFYEAAELARGVPAPTSTRVYLDAALTAMELGDDKAAEDYLIEAGAVLDDSLGIVEGLEGMYGKYFYVQGQLEEYRARLEGGGRFSEERAVRMDSLYQRAVDILSDPSLHLYEGLGALALAERAEIVGQRGEADRARQLLARAEATIKNGTQWTEVPFYIGMTRAAVEEADGRPAEGLRAAETVLEYTRSTSSLPSTYETEALELLGDLHRRMGSLDEAGGFYRQAIDRREEERVQKRLQDWSLTSFGLMQAPYRGLARVHLARGNGSDALATLDLGRARHLRDLRASQLARSSLSSGDRMRVEEWYDQVQAERVLLRQAVNASDQSRHRQRIYQFQDSARAAVGGEAPRQPRVEVRALQSRLEADRRALLSYLIEEDSSWVILVRPDTLLSLPLQVDRGSLMANLRQIGGPWSSEGGADPSFNVRALRQLYVQLFQPVERWLGGTTRVTVVPDGALASVPFAMMVTEVTESGPRYLVERYAFTTEAAASFVLAEEDGRPPSESNPAPIELFGRSKFSEGSPQGSRGTEDLQDLPFVPRELRRVRQNLGRGEVHLNSDATEAAWNREAEAAAVIHVGSHAVVDPEFPMYSRIFLWNGEGEQTDGVLHLYELLDRPLHSQLVTLSGCSTASGRLFTGEGMVGLQYGVRAAGAGATVATLWAVSDEATVDVMGAFYEGLSQHLPKDVALQQAQIQYLESHGGLAASPFYWAAPVLSGNPSPLHLPPKESRWVWALLAALGVSGVAWWLRSRRPHARSHRS